MTATTHALEEARARKAIAEAIAAVGQASAAAILACPSASHMLAVNEAASFALAGLKGMDYALRCLQEGVS